MNIYPSDIFIFLYIFSFVFLAAMFALLIGYGIGLVTKLVYPMWVCVVSIICLSYIIFFYNIDSIHAQRAKYEQDKNKQNLNSNIPAEKTVYKNVIWADEKNLNFRLDTF